tara:strand:- start:2602 stop:4665 length:2064 start_codon:yes stop_codon:yes gene_type:complete
MDATLFEALTGPLAQAGQIQANRRQMQLQEMQLAQQRRNQELAQLQRQEQYQGQLNTIVQAAQQDLYTKNNFSRQKDVDDFRNWHNTMSGWGDIQEVLRQHGSIDNARLYGNLDYLIAEYRAKLTDNPISRRVNKNKASLELFHSYALDKDGNDKLLTEGSKERYQQFLDGTTDNFIFYGARKDYLDETIKARDISDRIDLDDIINDNELAIRSDMINDMNADPNTTFDRSQMKAWLSKELQVTPGLKAGESFFGGEAMFGSKEIDTNAHSQIKDMLQATDAAGLVTGSDYFSNFNLDNKETFQKYYNSLGLGQNFQRFGGYDPNARPFDYSDDAYGGLTKGRQMVSSGGVFIDKGIEDQITRAVFGDREDGVPKYNSGDRMIDNVKMAGLYDKTGHKITLDETDADAGWFMNMLGKGELWGEEDEMDLKLNGYFVGFKGIDRNGDHILLTDVTNEDDRKKLEKEYKNIEFTPVIIAELFDDDVLTQDEVYYKELDLGDYAVLDRINKNINPENLNEVLEQTSTYEQKEANRKYKEKKQIAADAKLAKMLNMKDPESVDELISGYDQKLTVSLGLSQVPSVKVQQAVPLIMSDLYIDSLQEREYPYDFTPNETDVNKKMIANSPGQYMAYSTKILTEGLISGNPAFEAMLRAIKTGNYQEYSRSNYDEKTYFASRKLSRAIMGKQNR